MDQLRTFLKTAWERCQQIAARLWARHKAQPVRWAIVDIVVLALLALFFWPVPYDAAAWKPKPNPYGSGVFAANQLLARAKLLPVDGAGPEGIDIGADGLIYTGLDDGRIVRLNEDGRQEVLANTHGRPLGVQFDADGSLVIADAFKGLMRLAPDGTLELLTDTYNGERMIFVDDLDIGSDGRIWFSDASTRFDLHHNLLDFFGNDPSGRLMVYDPASGRTDLALDNLAFANGVALAADESFVLVNETFRNKIMRYWLSGPKQGTSDVFIENLPGYPDNITRDADGRFWIALVAPRTDLLDALMPYPFLRKAAWRLMQLAGASPVTPGSWAVAVDAEGNVLHNLEDPTGRIFALTSVIAHEGQLYLGSLTSPAIGILTAP